MGRPKAIEDSELLELLDSYVVEVCDGNPDRVKFSGLAKYARSKGYENVESYTISRSEAVRKHLEDIRENYDKDNYTAKVTVFQRLNVDEFLKKNHSPELLKKALVTRDMYYEKIHNSCAYYMRKSREASREAEESRIKSEKLRKKIDELDSRLDEMKKALDTVREENCMQRDYIKTYVDPGIAATILQKCEDRAAGMASSVNVSGINEEAVKKNTVKADTPVKFNNNIVQGLFDRLNTDNEDK